MTNSTSSASGPGLFGNLWQRIAAVFRTSRKVKVAAQPKPQEAKFSDVVSKALKASRDGCTYCGSKSPDHPAQIVSLAKWGRGPVKVFARKHLRVMLAGRSTRLRVKAPADRPAVDASLEVS